MAGFFGLFNYNKPGKGVRKDEPQKPRFLKFWELFIRKFWRLIQINLIYIAFCLPIVTIGPATAGLIYVLRNMANEQPVFLFSDFWDGFKNNLLQSFVYSLLFTGVSAVMWVAWRFYTLNLDNGWLMAAALGLCGVFALLVLFMSYYTPLMIVTLDLKLWAILKNAAILSIVCLKANMCTLLFLALTLAAALFNLAIGFLLAIFILPAFCGFIICFNSYPGIRRYIIDPYMAAHAGEESGAGPEAPLFEDKI